MFRLREWVYGTGVRHTRRARCGVIRGRRGALKVPDPRTVHPLSPSDRLVLLARQRPGAPGSRLAWTKFSTLCFYCIFLGSLQCGTVPLFRLREWVYGTGVRHTRRARCGVIRGCRGALKVPDPRTVHPLSPSERLVLLARQRPGAPGSRLAWTKFSTLCFYCIFLGSPQCGTVPLFRLRERVYGTGVRHTRRARCGVIRGCRGALKVPDPRTVHPLSPSDRKVLPARQRHTSINCFIFSKLGANVQFWYSFGRHLDRWNRSAPSLRYAIFGYALRRRFRTFGDKPGTPPPSPSQRAGARPPLALRPVG